MEIPDVVKRKGKGGKEKKKKGSWSQVERVEREK